MDYKKKYEEALARAREIYNDSFFNEGVSGHNLMERIFPELRQDIVPFTKKSDNNIKWK